MFFIKFSPFVGDTILNESEFSGKYAVNINNTHLLILNDYVTPNDLLSLSEQAAGLDTETALIAFQTNTGGNVYFAEISTQVNSLIEIGTFVPNLDTYIDYNLLYDVGFSDPIAPYFYRVFSEYIYNVKYDGVLEPIYPLSENQLTALQFYITDTNDVLIELEKFNNPKLTEEYTCELYDEMSFLLDLTFWQSLVPTVETEKIITQLIAFKDYSEGIDVFNLSSCDEYYKLVNQSLRDDFIRDEQNNIFNKMILAIDETRQPEPNFTAVREGLSLFYKYFTYLTVDKDGTI